MAEPKLRHCLYLRTKSAYFRNSAGERIFEPANSTACYTCLKTLRPVGPDGMPADAESCHAQGRGCFQEER
jgi:hypothetical protein